MGYKKPDKVMVFNEDPDLQPITVDLPKPPKDPQSIVGYGLEHKNQKFKRPSIPKKLFKLNKDNSIPVFQKAQILKDEFEYYEEEITFIQREWDRRLNGVWYYINGKPTYIPGLYYFYLTVWYVDNAENANLPDYRERDRKFFIFSEFCENDEDCYGFVYPKHRREGATSKAACWNYEYVSRNRNSRGGIQSMTEKDAALVYQKHVVKGFRKMPFWFTPVFDGSTNPKSELNLQAPAVRVTNTNQAGGELDSIESMIDFAASGEGAYDGFRLERYHADEIGKLTTANAYRRHLIAKQCMTKLDKIIGKAIYTSTAGEMAKGGGMQFKKIIEKSNFHERDGNGRTASGMYTLFIPAVEGFMMDEFGGSLEKESLENLLNVRKQALEDEDYESLNESTRQFPIRLRDCFRNASDTDNFNMKIIQEQRDKYQFGNNDVVMGNFVWQGGQKDSRVIFEPNENGRFMVSYQYPNPKQSNRYYVDNGMRIPANSDKFIGGADTFKFNVTAGGKKSLGGGAVFMKRDFTIDKDSDPIEDWKTHRFCCTYLYKPHTKDDYCEDMLMMCVYYGCRIVPEINVPAVMDHFERRGYPGYLHYVLDKKTGKYKKNPGYNTGTEVRESIFRTYQQYIELHGHRLVHDDLLEQLQEIEYDMGDFDLFVAGGMCLIGMEDEGNFYRGEPEDDGDDVEDFFSVRYY